MESMRFTHDRRTGFIEAGTGGGIGWDFPIYREAVISKEIIIDDRAYTHPFSVYDGTRVQSDFYFLMCGRRGHR